MKVALYVRVSASRQVEKDLPIPSMIKKLRAYAGRHDMEVLEGHIYIDGGKTGMSARREAFQKMIEVAKAKPRHFDLLESMLEVVDEFYSRNLGPPTGASTRWPAGASASPRPSLTAAHSPAP